MAKNYKGYANEEVENIIDLTSYTDLRIMSLKDENMVLQGVDIRQWFSTQSDPSKKPTQKGVRFSADKLSDVIITLVSLLEEKDKIDVLERLKS